MSTSKVIFAAGASRSRTRQRKRSVQQPRPPKAIELPHERDERPAPTHRDPLVIRGPRDVVKRAADDVNAGRRDTERRGIPNDLPPPSK